MFTIDDTEEVVYEAGTVLDIELHRESGMYHVWLQRSQNVCPKGPSGHVGIRIFA